MTQSCSGGVGGGGGLRVAADDPHLVSLGGGRLSTAVTIHQLPVGKCIIYWALQFRDWNTTRVSTDNTMNDSML